MQSIERKDVQSIEMNYSLKKYFGGFLLQMQLVL